MPKFMGIDPGVTGAFAIIDEKFEIVLVKKFESFAEVYAAILAHEIRAVMMEEVRVWPGQAAQANTTFMKNAGGYEAILEALNVRRVFVSPQVWQRAVGSNVAKEPSKTRDKKERDKINREHKKKIKAKSIKVAREFFGLNHEIEEGEADALNIARYGISVFGASNG